MKKLFATALMLVMGVSMATAQKQTGFAMSSDLLLGYKDDIFVTTIGYDFGFKPLNFLYIGVGPMVRGSFGDGYSDFAAGGYGKVRFAIPLRNDKIAPFVDARGGYAYSFEVGEGGAMYGAGFGVRFNRRFSVGIYCDISIYEETSSQRVIVRYDRRKNPLTGQYQNYPVYGDGKTTSTETSFTPQLLFSIDF